MSLIRQNRDNDTPAGIIHRAAWVLADPDHLFADGYVRTASGIIVDVGRGRGYGSIGQVIDHGPGVLMPCLVNAHTHLELSALKNKTRTSQGFIPWVQSVISLRAQAGEENLGSAICKGIAQILSSGTRIIGDISSLGISRHFFLESELSGVWFKEFLGTESQEMPECKNVTAAKKLSIAGHAPHTTAGELLVLLKSAANKNKMPFSLHLAESADELEFLSTGKGPWADFLGQRGVDVSAVCSNGKGPVRYADHLGLLDSRTLGVHLLFADSRDIRMLAEKRVNVCLCLKSNQMLHGRLPKVVEMLSSGVQLCLGTDSLASNDSLNIFDEMKFLSQSFPEIAPEDVFAMASCNGAAALGMKDLFGRLTPGKQAKMMFLPIQAQRRQQILESIVNQAFSENISIID